MYNVEQKSDDADLVLCDRMAVAKQRCNGFARPSLTNAVNDTACTSARQHRATIAREKYEGQWTS
jgi:hypothetical protein